LQPKEVDPQDQSISAFFKRIYIWAMKGLLYDVHDDVKDDVDVTQMHDAAEIFAPETETVFKYLQVMSACAVAFAHGEGTVLLRC
jgi:sodium-dependent phosphate transporter